MQIKARCGVVNPGYAASGQVSHYKASNRGNPTSYLRRVVQ